MRLELPHRANFSTARVRLQFANALPPHDDSKSRSRSFTHSAHRPKPDERDFLLAQPTSSRGMGAVDGVFDRLPVA